VAEFFSVFIAELAMFLFIFWS